MQSVEAEGESIDAAIASALEQLGVERDRVQIDILAGGARGVLGFGARKARVRATVKDSEASPPPPLDSGTRSVVPPPSFVPPSAADVQTAERARDILEQVVRLVGIDAQVQVRHADQHIILELLGDESGILIGRRGQMLDALEYVLNRIVLKDQTEATRLIIDSQDYRARRQMALEEMARRMADQAKNRRRPVTLNPMSPRDRRIVHLVLQDDPVVTTKSSGEGYYRKLVIIPKGSTRSPRQEG